ncbi:RimK family protein [Mangrovibacterium marinum]|uniref:SSU ribosomal protein S6P modification protein n=1 Tax=Mangrovibacterium marinum TaxID=1639118 RepID=A0A2T5C165_9BACT|nr:RimK family protein [Mangrovibacterium marinum]PTN08354.1 SSU ribosomal protein S6P modification protein [Mangrovibacterium marinum]
MQSTLILVDALEQWKPYYETESLITGADYLQNDELSKQPLLVINLCSSHQYHSEGYYCSLLAQARGHKVLPDVDVLNRIDNGALTRMDDLLQKLCYKWMQATNPAAESFDIDIYFGLTHEPELEKIARYIFEQLPCPLIRVTLANRAKNQIDSVKILGLHELTDVQEDLFATALDNFNKKVWRQPRHHKASRFDLAILYDPDEQLPPSNKGALNKFLSQARKMNINAELITEDDTARLLEFDGLFIRQTTALNHLTYRLAQKAHQADMVVIDDPLSIIRCTNKVYLKELLDREGIPTPKSKLIFKNNRASFAEVTACLGQPIVLKIPDGSFSVGMYKVNNEQEYEEALNELSQQTSVFLAQEFVPTPFDWRIGIINGEALYACKYFMARGHWQIYNHEGKKTRSGAWESVPIGKAPKQVVRSAVKAASLIGKGLYGVDVKEIEGKSLVIEVNDNPSIDHGVEDDILGDELYRRILREFVSRMELKGRR